MTARTIRFIPALDLHDLTAVERLAAAVGDHPLVSGYKVGFALGLLHGLPRVVETLRRHARQPIVYDHQKAATDIPDTGALFARTLRQAGIDEAILFPQAGPNTLVAWIEALRSEGLKVIGGGLMTHPTYVASEGGWLADAGVEAMYRTAVAHGVAAFVVPLTKPEAVARLLAAVPFPAGAEFYSPGFGRQGGDPRRFGALARHHLIVGRALLAAPDPVAWLEATARELEVSW